MWASVHKIDRVRPQPGGGAHVILEDERKAVAMARVPGLSTTIAVARVLNARRLLEKKYGGKGEVRYAANASLPDFLFDAVSRAGAAVTDLSGDEVILPPKPSGIASIIDMAFSSLANETRINCGVLEAAEALRRLEADRRKTPLQRESDHTRYWTSVFELSALAGELWRPRGGRWIDTHEMPVPFAIKPSEGNLLAKPCKLAQRIVDGEPVEESLATESLSID
jgi:hypothetical protein